MSTCGNQWRTYTCSLPEHPETTPHAQKGHGWLMTWAHRTSFPPEPCMDTWGDDVCSLADGHHGRHYAYDEETRTTSTWSVHRRQHVSGPATQDEYGDPVCKECGRNW